MAVILEESETRSPCRAYSAHYRRRQVGEVYTHARDLEEQGYLAGARRMLQAVLQLDDSHPFARRHPKLT